MKKFFIFSIGSVVSILLMLLTTNLIHRNLIPEQLGNYYYYYNIISLVYPAFCISAFSLYLRFGVAKKTNYFVNLASIIGTVIFSLVIYIWSGDYKLCLFSFIIFFQCELCKLRYVDALFKYNFYLNLQKVMFVLALFFLFERQYFDFNVLLFSLGGTYFCVFILMYFFKHTYSVSNEEVVAHSTLFKYGVNASFLVLFNWVILVSDQVIIKHFLGSVILAPYAVAYKISSIITIVSGIFMVYYPVVYFKEMKLKVGVEVTKLRWLFIFTMAITTALFISYDDFIYQILGSSKYLSSATLMKVLLVSEVLRVTASIFLIFNSFSLRLKYNFYLSMFIAILNLSLNFIFVESKGVFGVALVTLFCSVVYFSFSVRVYMNERLYVRA